MILIKLNSDNFEDIYMTPEVYEIVALEMSTGDYATHKIEAWIGPKEHAPEYCDTYEDTLHEDEISNEDEHQWYDI